jgi:hypothetical protein
MIYSKKYIKYVSKLNLIGGTKCKIEDTDKVLFGDGGSTAIIIITALNKAYKIFTTFYYDTNEDEEVEERLKKSNKRTLNEINISKILTENINSSKIPNHYVKYIGENECTDAKSLFKKCPEKYTDFLKQKEEEKDKLCRKIMQGHPHVKLQDKYNVVEIEYCNYSAKDFIVDVSNMDIIMMEKLLDIFFFQIILTIVKTREIFPKFNHNDLFMRNILGTKENYNYNYYEYEYNNKKYFIPQILFYPKINDFGLTNLDKNNKDRKLFDNEYKDIFNILYDVYNGGNLGGTSLTELCKDNEYKLKFIKKYFSSFFNIEKIDLFVTNSKGHVDWDWDNILDDEFRNEIKLVNPKDLLDDYFYKKFDKIHKIVK